VESTFEVDDFFFHLDSLLLCSALIHRTNPKHLIVPDT